MKGNTLCERCGEKAPPSQAVGSYRQKRRQVKKDTKGKVHGSHGTKLSGLSGITVLPETNHHRAERLDEQIDVRTSGEKP